MEIAAIVFYESNARYYHYLEKALKKKYNEAKIIQLCIYPSSVMYCKKHDLNYIHLTKEVRTRKPITEFTQDNFIRYHLKILPDYSKQIRKVAEQYYSFFTQFFKDHRIDLLICIGDERLYASIPSYVAKNQGIKVLYFEPGPFSTMIFDTKGVNCNMEIASIPVEQIKKINIDYSRLAELFDSTNNKRKFFHEDKLAYIRKIPDIIYSVPPKLLKKYFPIELQTGEYFLESLNYLRKRLVPHKAKNATSNNYDKFIFLALQVPTDVQMIIHSPIYRDFYSMVKDIYNAIPKDFKLVLREHPMNIGRYGKDIYNFVNSKENIFIDNYTPINQLIEKSELVIVNNSTVGVEALKYGKTVVALGKTYYSQVVYNVDDRRKLPEVINKALVNKIPKSLIEKYLYLLYTNYLIKDHYKNLKYVNLNSVINLLEMQLER